MKFFILSLLLNVNPNLNKSIEPIAIGIDKKSIPEFLRTIKIVANNGCVYGALELKKRKNINLSDKEMDSLSAYCNEVGDSAVKGIKDANGL